MNKTTRVCTLLLSLIAIALFAADSPRPEKGDVKRYQLFAAEVEGRRRDGSAYTTKRVFRIDSATGRTWVFQSTMATSAPFQGEFWSEVSEADEVAAKIRARGDTNIERAR